MGLGILLFLGMVGSFIEAYLLKQGGDAFNHIIVLGLLFAAAAAHQLQKAVGDSEETPPGKS